MGVKFEWQGFDVTSEGVDIDDSAQKVEVFNPYPKGWAIHLCYAFSTPAIKKRIRIVDRAILKRLKL